MTRPQRGTAIVADSRGVLVMLAGEGKELTLPGSRVVEGETGLQAALRGLQASAGLQVNAVLPLFHYISRFERHLVYFVQSTGTPQRRGDVHYLGYYQQGQLTALAHPPGYRPVSIFDMAQSTLAIARVYYRYRAQYDNLFKALEGFTSLDLKTYLRMSHGGVVTLGRDALINL